MLESVKELIYAKTGSAEMFDGLTYVCQAGSFISGTNDETSDLDFRGITILGDDYYIGLKRFDHTKLVGGEGNINLKDDLDIEIFSPLHFIKEAYHGEIIPFEMLHVGENFHVLMGEIVAPIFENREIFLSKSVINKYLSFIKARMNQALHMRSPKRPDKIHRIETCGYETKDAMNSIKCSEIALELLNGERPNLYRANRTELLDIKKGKYTRDEYEKIIAELIAEIEDKKSTSSYLPESADYNQVSQFAKSYMRHVYEVKNILG